MKDFFIVTGAALAFGIPLVFAYTAFRSVQEPVAAEVYTCFTPQKDVTAYEVATIFKYVQARSPNLLEDHPEMKRHTTVQATPCRP